MPVSKTPDWRFPFYRTGGTKPPEYSAELSDKGREAYEAFMVKLLSLTETENCDSFIKGYRLGTKLLLAALLDYDTPLPQVSEG